MLKKWVGANSWLPFAWKIVKQRTTSRLSLRKSFFVRHLLQVQHSIIIMKTVRVSHKPGEDTMLVSMDINGKIRSMNRPTSEPLEKFYTRVQVTLAQQQDKQARKLMKKKPSETITDAIKSSNTPTVSLLDSDGNAFSVEDKASDAFAKADILRLPNDDYKVLYNSPHVIRVSLPLAPVSCTVLFPNLEFEFATQEFSRFSWYRSTLSTTDIGQGGTSSTDWQGQQCENSGDHSGNKSDQNEWTFLHHNKIHPLSKNDVGRKFRVVVTPGNKNYPAVDDEANPDIPSFDAISGAVVAGLESYYFTPRHAYTQKACDHESFRFVCYNILADCYASSEFAQNELFPYCPSSAIDMSYRIQLTMKELSGYNCDVICLQEVDRFVFEDHLVPALSLQNFGGAFAAKRQTKEGVALFYNRSKFKLQSVKNKILQESLDNDDINSYLKSGISANKTSLLDRVRQKGTCVLIAVLQSVDDPNRVLVVANTHLFWHPHAQHIRIVQMSIVLNNLQQVVKEVADSHGPDCNVSYILCGDLNSQPYTGAIELVETGKVPPNCSDWYSGGKQDFHNCSTLHVTHDLKFISTCGHPEYTNYVSGFVGCLDYIFVNPDQLSVEQVVPQPDHELTVKYSALPNISSPSDHIAQVVDLRWQPNSKL